MSEWKNYLNLGELTLDEFVKIVRGSKVKIARLEEKLKWTIHLIYSIPGPVYGEVIHGSNVQEDKFVVLLDKKDKLEKKINYLFECEAVLQKFLASLTEKEKNVFHLRYFKNLSQNQIGIDMDISQQAVSQYIDKINKKWLTKTNDIILLFS
ncbi:MAG: sigma-70 family RNA polymerase sigma factor [Bacilli bacterium]